MLQYIRNLFHQRLPRVIRMHQIRFGRALPRTPLRELATLPKSRSWMGKGYPYTCPSPSTLCLPNTTYFSFMRAWPSPICNNWTRTEQLTECGRCTALPSTASNDSWLFPFASEGFLFVIVNSNFRCIVSSNFTNLSAYSSTVILLLSSLINFLTSFINRSLSSLAPSLSLTVFQLPFLQTPF